MGCLMEIDSLIAAIHSAFDGIPYPSGHDFYKAIADRDYKEMISGQEKKWEDISEQEILKFYDFVFFLKPSGVIYYLPAYMEWVLRSKDVAEEAPAEALFMAIMDLDPRLLTLNQQKVVKEFLIHCRDILSQKVEMDMSLVEDALRRASM